MENKLFPITKNLHFKVMYGVIIQDDCLSELWTSFVFRDTFVIRNLQAVLFLCRGNIGSLKNYKFYPVGCQVNTNKLIYIYIIYITKKRMCCKLCIICLKTANSIKSILDLDETGVKFSFKLQSIAPEVEWRDSFLICYACTEQLSSAYKFRELCLNINKQIKNEGTDAFEEVSEKSDCTTKETYICYDCKEKHCSKEDLIEHIKKKHSGKGAKENARKYHSKKYKCRKCGRRYVSTSSLKEHWSKCDGIKRHSKCKADHQCIKCGKYYTTEKIMKSHLKKCTIEQKNFQCENCNKHYKTLKTLKDHYFKTGCKKDSDNLKLGIFCKICDEYFETELQLRRHNIKFHKTLDFFCEFCAANFEDQKNLELHKSSKHNRLKTDNDLGTSSRKFTCEVCGEDFALLKNILEHCVNIHAMNEKSVKPYSCNVCNNRFRTSTNLLNHRLYHEGNRVNICSFCGKSFITKNDLTAHEYTHLSQRNYKCDKCEKAFKTNTNLRTHCLIVHTDPLLWKYVCHVCNKRFPQKSNHDQHLRRHTGEKNFHCPLCRKPFASKSEMQEHLSYHSNVKAYKCEHCPREYRKKYTCDVHLAKVHGIGNAKIPVREKKYACHICPSRFYDRLKLARHLCTHSGIKPFGCYACEKKFTDKSYLKHHLKVAHNIIEEPKTV